MKTEKELMEIFKTVKDYSPKTIKIYTQQIKFWQELLGNLDNVTLSNIEGAVNTLKRIKPARSVKLSLAALKTFYYLIGDPLHKEINLMQLGVFIDENRRKYISSERLENIIITEKPDYENPIEIRDYTAFLTFINTGAKLNEVYKLKFDDFYIDTEKPFIRLNSGEKTQRDVPIDNFFIVYLHCALPIWNEALLNHGIKKPKFIFTAIYNEEPMHPRMMEKILSKYNLTANEIRNTFLANLQRKNTSAKTISRLLGISEYSARKHYKFVD